MSATGRNLPGHERHPDDYYQTPAWAVHALLDALPDWRPTLDPGCGTGAIAAVCRERGHDVVGIELDPERRIAAQERGVPCTCEDALSVPWTGRAVVCNPPYSEAADWIAKAVNEADSAALLLPLSILAGQCRAAWWRENPPAVVAVLSKRPSFAHGKTDAREYAWIVWTRPNTGTTRMLWLTPGEGAL